MCTTHVTLGRDANDLRGCRGLREPGHHRTRAFHPLGREVGPRRPQVPRHHCNAMGLGVLSDPLLVHLDLLASPVSLSTLAGSTYRLHMCVFCSIVEGREPAQIVFEDDISLAFLDARPVFLGHTLLVPKEHHETLPDLPVELVRLSSSTGGLSPPR